MIQISTDIQTTRIFLRHLVFRLLHLQREGKD